MSKHEKATVKTTKNELSMAIIAKNHLSFTNQMALLSFTGRP
jgi:hypothetical protein